MVIPSNNINICYASKKNKKKVGDVLFSMRSTVHAVTPNEMFHDTLKQLITLMLPLHSPMPCVTTHRA